jgi:hypothetical protein
MISFARVHPGGEDDWLRPALHSWPRKGPLLLDHGSLLEVIVVREVFRARQKKRCLSIAISRQQFAFWDPLAHLRIKCQAGA